MKTEHEPKKRKFINSITRDESNIVKNDSFKSIKQRNTNHLLHINHIQDDKEEPIKIIRKITKVIVKSLSEKPKKIISSNPISEKENEDIDSDDEDILNENVPIEIKIEAMEKATKIMSKSKNNIHRRTNPNSSRSWLMHTIKNIITKIDKTMSKHRFKFENT